MRSSEGQRHVRGEGDERVRREGKEGFLSKYFGH